MVHPRINTTYKNPPQHHDESDDDDAHTLLISQGRRRNHRSSSSSSSSRNKMNNNKRPIRRRRIISSDDKDDYQVLKRRNTHSKVENMENRRKRKKDYWGIVDSGSTTDDSDRDMSEMNGRYIDDKQIETKRCGPKKNVWESSSSETTPEREGVRKTATEEATTETVVPAIELVPETRVDLKVEMSRELDEVRAKLYEREKFLAELQCEMDTLRNSLTTKKEINEKHEQFLTKASEDLVRKTTEILRGNGRINEPELHMSTLEKINMNQEQDLTKVGEDLLRITTKTVVLTQRGKERINTLESQISTLKEINMKQEQDLTKVREDLVKRTSETEVANERINALESQISTLKEINMKQEQDLTKVREDLVKGTSETELLNCPLCTLELGSYSSPRYKGPIDDVLQSTGNVLEPSKRCCYELLTLVSAEKQLMKDENEDLKASLKKLSHDKDTVIKTMTQEIDDLKSEIARAMDEVLAKLYEVKRRMNEVQCERDILASSLTAQKEINTKQEQDLANVREELLKRMAEIEWLTQILKENSKSAQIKECDMFNAIEKKCDELDALNYTLREKENQLSDAEQMIANLQSKVAEMTQALEDQKRETELQAYLEELGGELNSKKDSMICNLLTEAKTRADNVVEEVELDYRMDHDGPYESDVTGKRKLEVGISDAYFKSKSMETPDIHSPGSVVRAVNKRAEEDTSKTKLVTPDCKEVICLSNEQLFPVKTESYPLINSVYFRMDLLVKFLMSRSRETPNGSVIWSGKGPFSEVTAADAVKVLNRKRLTSGIIDSWGDLLLQHLNKKRKMTSAFIFTSRIWEVVGRNGGSSSIQEIVDSQIRKAVESDILILPVFTPGAVYGSKYVGNHWTLLMYDSRSYTWTIFNSMQPGGTDHFERCFPPGASLNFRPRAVDLTAQVLSRCCFPLMEYIMSRLLPAMSDLKLNAPLRRTNINGSNISLQEIIIPLQKSLDSGVNVCHVMEKILTGQVISKIKTSAMKGVYSETKAANYRFRMVEMFCFPDNTKKELLKHENQDMKASMKQLLHQNEILHQTMTQTFDDLEAEISRSSEFRHFFCLSSFF